MNERRSQADYFRAEMAYLRDLGAEFAQRHGDLATHLLAPGADPSVERLLEGVAFLTARIRRRLDDELPELSQALMQLLWPAYLRPLPAMAILQFDTPAEPASVLTVSRGARVRARARDASPREAVEFRTVYPVHLLPITLERVVAEDVGRRSRLRLTIRLRAGLNCATFAALVNSRTGEIPLRLHFNGESRFASLLACALQRPLHGPVLAREPGGASVVLPAPRAVGLSDDEALLDGWQRSFQGFRLLFEYLSLPEKLLFVDVSGLSRIAELGRATQFDLEVPLSLKLPGDPPLDASNVRLGCTPVVNLFGCAAAPFNRRPHRDEYRVTPAGAADATVYSITEVSGVAQRSTRVVYRPFMQQVATAAPNVPPTMWYDLRVRPSDTTERAPRGPEAWVALSVPTDFGTDEVISITLTGLNWHLPRTLGPTANVEGIEQVPAGVRGRLLGVPTLPVPAPLDRGLAWRLVAHLALSRRTLASREALQDLLLLYDFPALHSQEKATVHRRRLEAIEEVTATPTDRLVSVEALPGRVRGSPGRMRVPMRGTRVTVRVHFESFGGLGQVHLFGVVLDELLSMWTSLNSFTELSIVDAENTQETLAWPPRLGNRVLV